MSSPVWEIPLETKGCHIISKLYCHNVLSSVQYDSSVIPEHTMSVMQCKHSSEALCLWIHRWFLLSFQSVCMSRYRYVHTEACSIVSVNFSSITSCALQGYSKVCVLELTYVHLLWVFKLRKSFYRVAVSLRDNLSMCTCVRLHSYIHKSKN